MSAKARGKKPETLSEGGKDSLVPMGDVDAVSESTTHKRKVINISRSMRYSSRCH
jgi:hypothetical protein